MPYRHLKATFQISSSIRNFHLGALPRVMTVGQAQNDPDKLITLPLLSSLEPSSFLESRRA